MHHNPQKQVGQSILLLSSSSTLGHSARMVLASFDRVLQSRRAFAHKWSRRASLRHHYVKRLFPALDWRLMGRNKEIKGSKIICPDVPIHTSVCVCVLTTHTLPLPLPHRISHQFYISFRTMSSLFPLHRVFWQCSILIPTSSATVLNILMSLLKTRVLINP